MMVHRSMGRAAAPGARSRTRLLLGALLLEGAIGYPSPLFRAIGHPVSWIGALLAALDRGWNDPSLPASRRRRRGEAALAAALAASGVAAVLAARAGGRTAIVAGTAALLAARSLDDHVRAVADALEGPGGLAAGREMLARIVGRDVATLDEPAVCRAAIESLAENFSDGVVAPALAFLAFGLPGIALYKAVNTADSMIGHRTARHEDFGRAAARLDDVVNLPASRSAALLLALASGRPFASLGAVRRSARLHRSPNAGWPESAMAGALGIRLAGPRRYEGVARDDRWMGSGRAALGPADIGRALRLYRRAVALGALGLLIGQGRRPG